VRAIRLTVSEGPKAIDTIRDCHYLPGISEAFKFDLRAERQTVGAEGGPRRREAGLEIGDIDLVEGLPLRDVGEYHRAFEHVVE
jgi:hypothetical protein